MMPVNEIRNRIYAVLVFALLLFSMQHVQAAALNAADDAALVALYNTTTGAGWSNNTGWSGTVGVMDTVTNPPYGVTFDVSGRVTQLALSSNNLVGDISALDLSGLSFTITLTFNNNSMSGSLPAVTQLPSGLQTLNLGANQMTGAFPDYNSMAALITLQLYGNQLSGNLPPASLLPPLIETLSLGNNQFTGSFPDYSSLLQLKWLFLASNQLSGSPPLAAQLPSTIQGLTIAFNQLTGTIPDYSSLTALGGLSFYFNQLSGNLPTAAQLPPGLGVISVYNNQLTGTIPDYSTHASLQILYLYNNQLSGNLPTVAQLPSGLTDLHLSGNQFSGTIPDYSSLPLFYFNLSQLNIQGPTPSGLLALSGTGVMTTTPVIDPALDGNYVSASVIPVTGTGGELSGTVDLLLDSVTEATGITVGGVGEWSSSVDLTGKVDGAYVLSATSSYTGWPGHTGTTTSDLSSTAVTLYIDTTPPVITLIGPATQTIAHGSTYTDLGATVTDNIDTGLVVVVSGSVDTNTVGSYPLTFNVTDNGGNVAIEKTRTVNVTDQTAPVITLLGSNPMTVNQGSTFTDPGATVSDNVETSLTATVSGTVDTATVGSYILTYNATDTAGNAATSVTRTVNVVASSSSGGGGGGSFGWMLLLMLILHFAMTKRRAAE